MLNANSSHSVFWFADKDVASAEAVVCRSGHFIEKNSYTKQHHYLSEKYTKVAKLFQTEAKSQEQEPIYKALNQVLGAHVSMYRHPTIVPDLVQNDRGTTIKLNYPVVVCSDFLRFFATDFFDASEPREIEENFQLEIRYAYLDLDGRTKSEHFLVDFVAFDKLEEFCASLVRNGEVAGFLSQN